MASVSGGRLGSRIFENSFSFIGDDGSARGIVVASSCGFILF